MKHPNNQKGRGKKKSYNTYWWQREYKECMERQKKLQSRIKMMDEIIEMRLKNKATLEKIAQKYGFSKEWARQLCIQWELD